MKNLKNHFGKLAIIVLALGFLTSQTGCTPPPPPPPPPAPCVTTGTDFQTLYTNTLALSSAYNNYTTMDLVTHEYTFFISTNKTVCSIGYQGNANLFTASIPYTIEIYDNTNSMLVYSGNHVFNSAFTDYVTPTAPINLTAGNSYTIKRKAVNYLGNIGNTIGRICRFSNSPAPPVVPYPVNFGIMTITASNFYGTGGPVPNYGIPYIDIVFQ